MNILILYETYSGGTLQAVEFASSLLKEKGHTTTIIQTHLCDPKTFHQYDLVIMATPSWLERSEEGQPHVYFLNFMDHAKDLSFQGTSFALFGLGDSTYAHFCKAVDRLETFVKEKGGTLVGKTLKIDSYLFDQKKGNESLSQWLHSLPLS